MRKSSPDIRERAQVYGRKRFLKLVGDATHNKSREKLKVLNLSFVGTHYHNQAWSKTVLPVLVCICHEECIWSLEEATNSLIEAVSQHLGLSLEEFVSDWFWDGAAKAQNVFSRLFPEARGHTCLEHAKRNASRRAQGVGCP